MVITLTVIKFFRTYTHIYTHIHIHSHSLTYPPSKSGRYHRAALPPSLSPFIVNPQRHHCSLVLLHLVNEPSVTGGGQAKAVCGSERLPRLMGAW